MVIQPAVRQHFKKHVSAIHTSGVLSLLERKLSNVLLLHAYDRLLLDRTHTLSVALLSAFLGFDSKDTGALKRALQSLVTTAIEFNLMDDGKEKWSITSMLSFAEIRGGICTWRYDEHLAERLYDPEVYAIINVSVQRQLQSSHSLALYENCVRYRKVGSTGWWDVERFRKLMGTTSEAYTEFRRLNEKVIRPAVAEINRSSDLQIGVELERKGRGGKVSSLRFVIKEHPQQVLFKPEASSRKHGLENNAAFVSLRELGVSERLAATTVQQDEEWAMAIAQSTKGRVAAGKVRNPAAYAAKLILERAVIDAPKRLEIETTPPQTPVLPITAAQREAYRLDFENARGASMVASLSDERRIQLCREFVAHREQAGDRGARVTVDLKAGHVFGTAANVFARYVLSLEARDNTEEFEQYVERRTAGERRR